MGLVTDVLARDRTKMQRPPLNGHDVMALTGLPVSSTPACLQYGQIHVCFE
jgi:hypothetical protein